MKIIIEIEVDEGLVVKKEQRDNPNSGVKEFEDVDMDFIAQLYTDLIENDGDITQEFTKSVDYYLKED